MSDLKETIALIGVRIGLLEGFIEAQTALLNAVLPIAYADNLQNLLRAYQEALDEIDQQL